MALSAGGLSCSGDQWTATVIDDGATVLVPLEPVGANLVGTVSGYTVTIKNPCPQPKRTVQYEAAFVSCKCNEAIFSIGDPVVCTDPKDPGGPCKNTALIKVRWDCCGDFEPGWYCVSRADGVGCIPAELLDEDRCDPDLTICSGPYEDEAAAAAVCPSLVGGQDCFDTDGLVSPTPCYPGPLLTVPPGETLFWHFEVTPATFYRLGFHYLFAGPQFEIVVYSKEDCVDAVGAAEHGRYTHDGEPTETGVEFFINLGAVPTHTCICVEITNTIPGPEHDFAWAAYLDLLEGPECEEE